MMPFKAGEITMSNSSRPIRVLYSFPLRLGVDRICYIAWQQVNGLAEAGAEVQVVPASVARPVPPGVGVASTLEWGKLRLPFRVVGTMRAVALHDRIVARRLEALAGKIDLIHTWPLGALETLEKAGKLGIPTVLERPNAHTRFAMEIVQAESNRLGIKLPPDHEHAFNKEKVEREEAEYKLATRLLCPADFVVKTFLDRGFARQQLVRHTYGYDDKTYFPAAANRNPDRGLTMLFVGVCAVRKGVHFALEAWLNSPASKNGKFLIAGEFLPAYRDKLAPMLAHPSVTVLGHRNDVPELMRQSDLLILPSIEEGFGLVIAEAMGSGCVPLASDACTEICQHMQSGFTHRVGDVDALAQQITILHENRELLMKLRAGALEAAKDVTWTAAGRTLLRAYRETIEGYRNHSFTGNVTETKAVSVL
jgi:glycosyltransferase involved in cell wall biosynthesis